MQCDFIWSYREAQWKRSYNLLVKEKKKYQTDHDDDENTTTTTTNTRQRIVHVNFKKG